MFPICFLPLSIVLQFFADLALDVVDGGSVLGSCLVEGLVEFNVVSTIMRPQTGSTLYTYTQTLSWFSGPFYHFSPFISSVIIVASDMPPVSMSYWSVDEPQIPKFNLRIEEFKPDSYKAFEPVGVKNLMYKAVLV